MNQSELEVLYHGTKFKYNADKILKEGFNKMTFFSYDLGTAIGQGGKYVFEVVFLKSDLPDYWQVRCEVEIPPIRIVRLSKYKEEEVFKNQDVQSALFSNADEHFIRKPYVFEDNFNYALKSASVFNKKTYGNS